MVMEYELLLSPQAGGKQPENRITVPGCPSALDDEDTKGAV